jgi:hypothetical protein
LKKLKLILPVLFIIGGVSLIFFIKKGNSTGKELFPDTFFSKGANVEWMGIYLKGHKVGYLASRIDSTEVGYRVYSNTYMKIAPAAGYEREVSYQVVANTDKDYNLSDFHFRMVSGEYVFIAYGRKIGKKLSVEMEIGGNKREMEFPLKSSYLPATIEGMVKTGRTGTFQFFDPTLQSIFDISIENLGHDTLEGVPTTKYAVQQSGIDVYFWVSSEGHLIRQESPIGLVMKRETDVNLSDIETVGFKLFDSYAIRVDNPIENPRMLNMLKVRLDSVDLSGLRIEDDRQKLRGNILTIKKVTPGDSDEIPEEVEPYRQPTPFVPSDDELVGKTALDVIGGKKGWEAVKRIITFVDTTLRDNPTFSIPNALDALKSKEGDCNEHSALTVALLRAVGIPARVEVGVVYVGGAFYYHAWVGVYMGGKWVATDPTFGQLIADPAHIKLEYGGFKEQAKLYRVINKLRISVLQYD